jgi:hypothetical protein
MYNNKEDLQKCIASLESHVDLLETELSYLNELLVRCGFPEGVQTLKETAEEMLAEDAETSHLPEKF